MAIRKCPIPYARYRFWQVDTAETGAIVKCIISYARYRFRHDNTAETFTIRKRIIPNARNTICHYSRINNIISPHFRIIVFMPIHSLEIRWIIINVLPCPILHSSLTFNHQHAIAIKRPREVRSVTFPSAVTSVNNLRRFNIHGKSHNDKSEQRNQQTYSFFHAMFLHFSAFWPDVTHHYLQLAGHSCDFVRLSLLFTWHSIIRH